MEPTTHRVSFATPDPRTGSSHRSAFAQVGSRRTSRSTRPAAFHARNRRLGRVTLALAILLLVNAGFTVVVWPIFYRRVSNDTRARDAAGKATRFLSVHRVIVGIAYLIAAASAIAAIVSFF